MLASFILERKYISIHASAYIPALGFVSNEPLSVPTDIRGTIWSSRVLASLITLLFRTTILLQVTSTELDADFGIDTLQVITGAKDGCSTGP